MASAELPDEPRLKIWQNRQKMGLVIPPATLIYLCVLPIASNCEKIGDESPRQC